LGPILLQVGVESPKGKSLRTRPADEKFVQGIKGYPVSIEKGCGDHI
jgi:hypothetical protein